MSEQDVTQTQDAPPPASAGGEPAAAAAPPPTEQAANSSSEGGPEHQPKEGSPRWNKLYRNWKDGERENAKLEERNGELETEVRAMRSDLNEFVTSSKQAKYNEDLAEAERQMNDAFSSQDDDAFNKAKIYLKNVQDNAPQAKPKQDQVATVNEQSAQTSRAVETFKKYNSWYENDLDLTNRAHEINRELVQDPRWNSRSEDELLAEVSRRTIEYADITDNPYNKGQGMVNGLSGDGGELPTANDSIEEKVARLTTEQKKVAVKTAPELSQTEAYRVYAKNT